jgi:hypothetical protein
MKGFFWNSRGLSDLAKFQYISEAVKDHNLDFIAIMETGKQDISKTNLAQLSGGVQISFGIVFHLVVDLVESFSESIQKCYTFP